MMMYWWILIGIIIIAAIILPVSRWKRDKQKPGEAPMQILEKRYASGELSRAEFEEQKRTLSKKT